MIKFQIGKLTFKKFLLHWMVSIILVVISFFYIRKESNLKEILVIISIFSIFLGMLGSILLIAFVKEVIEDINNKDYKVVIATIIFAKYFFKL
ncbi:hypothetical protein H3N56_02390 [Cetobacterium sp. 2A]|uniref:hypothetical protein n=1 Tax=Cetobacterium sp. 2A TaxID=2754723 RepID=UPI00163D01E9|nr:hypothetical protein [Cetobacterium sp. 2A]MBC2855341.1 hypothetical protein [Cetobacterium sp. 2A]